MKHKPVAGPLKWPGGKAPLATKIADVLRSTQYSHYVEPFFGGGSVMLALDPEGVSEVVNDLNKGLTNLWNVLKHDHTFKAFQRVIEATPFSEVEYRTASSLLRNFGWSGVPTSGDIPAESTAACVLRACNFFISCRQSLAGMQKSFAPLSRTRTRRGLNEQASAWLSAVEGLPEVHTRLKRVVILNRDALDVMRAEDGPHTLQYLDPPYLHETRAAKMLYEHEQDEEFHREMLHLALTGKSKFAISGYPSPMYDGLLKDWNRHVFDVPNHLSTGKSKDREQEVLYCNF
jgi:DNA adenine methylase